MVSVYPESRDSDLKRWRWPIATEGDNDGQAGETKDEAVERRRFERKQRQKEEKRDRRREEIKQAAIEIFADQGYHAAKVSNIVDRVDIAKGTFYLYYDGKRQIFEEILEDFLSLLLETIANWEPAELDSREALEQELRRVGLRLTDVLAERQALASIYFKESMSTSPEFESLVRGFHEALSAMLTQFNEVLHDRGLIAEANFEILANATIGMVERIVMEYVVHDNLQELPHEELVDHLVVHYLSGTRDPIGVERDTK